MHRAALALLRDVARSDPATAAQLAHRNAYLWLAQPGEHLDVHLRQLVVVLGPAGQHPRDVGREAVGRKQFAIWGLLAFSHLLMPNTMGG